MYGYIFFAIFIVAIFSIFENIKGYQKMSFFKVHLQIALFFIALGSFLFFLDEIGINVSIYTDIQVKGGPANTLVIARWTATCHLLNGEPYENKGVHFITIKWGKAVKFDVYENTKVVSHGLDIQFEAGIKEAKAPKIVS
jgi:hypothetical protein